jgi:hypothetical protein
VKVSFLKKTSSKKKKEEEIRLKSFEENFEKSLKKI